MSSPNVFSAGAAALVLSLGCSGGDLTLPSSDTPAALVVVSGDGQRAEAGTLLEEPLMVQLLDGSSRPVRHAPVQFSFVGDLPGAGLDPASVLTDEEGRAAAVVRLGEVIGEQLIVAQVANTTISDLRARFSATAVPPDKDLAMVAAITVGVAATTAIPMVMAVRMTTVKEVTTGRCLGRYSRGARSRCSRIPGTRSGCNSHTLKVRRPQR